MKEYQADIGTWESGIVRKIEAKNPKEALEYFISLRLGDVVQIVELPSKRYVYSRYSSTGEFWPDLPTNEDRCAYCGEVVENLCTAYLLNQKTIEGLCPTCKENEKKKDIDKMTYECLKKLCGAVNAGSSKDLADSLMRSITRQHRHLQSEFFNTLGHFFRVYGNQTEAQYDARNEWAVKLTKKWAEVG